MVYFGILIMKGCALKIRRTHIVKTRFLNSYMNGIAKAMDANNEIRVFHRVKKSTIYTAWKDVGNDLTDVMIDYDNRTKKSEEKEAPVYGE